MLFETHLFNLTTEKVTNNKQLSSIMDASKEASTMQKVKKPSQNKRRTERRRKAFEEQLKNPDKYVPLPVARRKKPKRNSNPSTLKMQSSFKSEISKTITSPKISLVPSASTDDPDILELRASPINFSPVRPNSPLTLNEVDKIDFNKLPPTPGKNIIFPPVRERQTTGNNTESRNRKRVQSSLKNSPAKKSKSTHRVKRTPTKRSPRSSQTEHHPKNKEVSRRLKSVICEPTVRRQLF
ncbi:uncharacterized protein LOC122497599 [Leptopilina heterotoma]|uniref:uncharacterized protein LOC122497599 n=1 Tax=Leptopilina heterotoma TaxID=63436 RepID=UPI001CA95650|nr:uncharacterized protein LOC122497599 [Leptopilina heterotoma]